MKAPNPPVQGRQAELEARALQLRVVDLNKPIDLKSAFGAAPEWTMQVGPARLLLVPFLGQWWFFDEAHGEWRFTGKTIGEARFVTENGRLQVVEVVGQEQPLEQGQNSPEHTPAAPRVRRFCSACGAPVQSTWKFCQKCGSKLLPLP